MSVNLPRTYRVIMIVIVVGVAFSTLAWSGGNRLQPVSKPCTDTIPAHHNKQDRKAVKHGHRQEEGRVARELDLRIDAEEPETLYETDLSGDVDIHIDLEDLKGLNARIEADVFKNADVWKTLEAMKDLDALEELDCIKIDEDDLRELKDLNIDEDIWNELRDLKVEMDDLREELDNDLTGKMNDYRVREEIRRVVEAVKMEIPRVRREVEKALQPYQESQQWQ
jgi:hypothetical protein